MIVKTLVVVATITLMALPQSAGQRKPVVTDLAFICYMSRPETLDETVTSANAVVVGKVQSSRTYLPDQSSWRTISTVAISDVIRDHPSLTKPSVEVYQFGGDGDEGTHVRRVIARGFPLLSHGDEYVLFLAWNDVLGGFELIWPESVYKLTATGTVTTHGEALRLAQAQNGRNAAAFVAQLKQIAHAHGYR